MCMFGAIRMAQHLRKPDFDEAKTYAIAGLWIGELLWSFAFITVGGEWFMMWESTTWNGEIAALRMFTVNGIALLFLHLVDGKTGNSTTV